MLSDEREQQEEDCYSRDPRSVETGSHAKRRNSTHISPIDEVMRSDRLRCLDMSTEEMRTTSPAE